MNLGQGALKVAQSMPHLITYSICVVLLDIPFSIIRQIERYFWGWDWNESSTSEIKERADPAGNTF